MNRNNLNGKNLFIRSCYNELYVEIIADIDDVLKTRRTPRFAITGTVGIGKSSFFLYFLWRHMEDKWEDKSFYYQDNQNFVMFYKNTDDFKFTITKVEGLTEKKYPLFVDMINENSPVTHLGTIIIFSSFKPGRFKELTKEGFVKIMPTWSYKEMSEYILSDSFGRDFGKTLDEREQTLSKFEYFGGCLRHVIYNDMDIIHQAINSKGAGLCAQYFKSGHGGIEDYISDVLIHRDPHIDNSGKVIYGGQCVYKFASEYISRKIFSKHHEIVIAEAKQKFAIGTMCGGEDGKTFELLCFHACNFSGKEFEATPLNNTSDLSDFRITFPVSDYLERDWKSSKNYLKANVLYLPRVGNLESGDAFCVMELNHISTLIVLQVTIAEAHPIKMKGLQTISKCFDEADGKIENKILIFITPENGTLNSKQNLHTPDSKVAKNIPKNIILFSKNQFKIENNLTC
jgi:hypothetical protein